MFPTIEAQTRLQTPPTWALLERQLIDKMNAAGPEVLQKYTRMQMAHCSGQQTRIFRASMDSTMLTRVSIIGPSFTCSVGTRNSWLMLTRNSMSSQTIWRGTTPVTVTRW